MLTDTLQQCIATLLRRNRAELCWLTEGSSCLPESSCPVCKRLEASMPKRYTYAYAVMMENLPVA